MLCDGHIGTHPDLQQNSNKLQSWTTTTLKKKKFKNKCVFTANISSMIDSIITSLPQSAQIVLKTFQIIYAVRCGVLVWFYFSFNWFVSTLVLHLLLRSGMWAFNFSFPLNSLSWYVCGLPHTGERTKVINKLHPHLFTE